MPQISFCVRLIIVLSNGPWICPQHQSALRNSLSHGVEIILIHSVPENGKYFFLLITTFLQELSNKSILKKVLWKPSNLKKLQSAQDLWQIKNWSWTLWSHNRAGSYSQTLWKWAVCCLPKISSLEWALPCSRLCSIHLRLATATVWFPLSAL